VVEDRWIDGGNGLDVRSGPLRRHILKLGDVVLGLLKAEVQASGQNPPKYDVDEAPECKEPVDHEVFS